jgi:hypothetical protein
MKKFAAIIIAVMLILTNFVMAYAADIFTCPTCNRKYDTLDEYNACIDKHIADSVEEPKQVVHKCSTCGKIFEDIDAYNECVGSHFNNVNYHYDKYVGLTIPELLAELVNIFNKTGTMEATQTVVDKLFELTSKSIDEDTFSFTMSELEIEIGKLDLDGDCLSKIKGILDNIKSKLLCNEDTKTEVEVTEAEPPADTGSSVGLGIAVFAAVSVAAAAAYVTTSKKN